MNLKKQAFTLVELIVVITILAILGTIAFLSLQGYSKDSRNSVRFNDLKLIESSLELYSQKTGFYPESTLPVTITFANAEAWTQGTFGEDTFGSVGKLDHLPLDPLTGTEYTYSLLNTKGEYELAAGLEGIVASNDTKLINKTYAGTLEGTSLVLGTYNGNMLKVSTGGLDYVLAVPTIVSGDITLLSVDEIMFYNKLAYNGSRVLAGNYKNTEFNTSKTFDYSPTVSELMVFTGSIDDLKVSESKRIQLLDNLQKAYSGTVLENNTNYKTLVGENINITTPTDNGKQLAKNIIENSLKIKIKAGVLANKYWVKKAGGSLSDYPLGGTRDINGNSYIVGLFRGTADIFGQSLTSSGSYDVFLSKLGSDGDLLWSKRAGGTSGDIGASTVVDVSGNVYVTGQFSGTADIFGQSLTSSGGGDIFLSKLDTSGNLIWTKKTGGTSSESPISVLLDSIGNIYITGIFQGTADIFGQNFTSFGGYDRFISKLDGNGNLLWAKRAGGIAHELGGSLVLDSSGNSYIAGIFSSTADIFGQNLTSSGGYDSFLSKLDSNGNLLWAKKIGGSGTDIISGSSLDSIGNIYLTGQFGGTADIFGQSLTSSGGDDIFLSKLDTSGNLLWAKKAGGLASDGGKGISIDVTGSIYLLGHLNGIADIFGQSLTSLGSNDIFLSKLDASGNLLWAKRAGGNGDEYGYSINLDPLSNIYISGHFSGTADIFGESITGSGNLDIFMAKLNKDGNLN